MWQALVTALRARGIDVQTALEAAMIERTDEDHREVPLLSLDSQSIVHYSANTYQWVEKALKCGGEKFVWHCRTHGRGGLRQLTERRNVID
jgi:hypothetical protein